MGTPSFPDKPAGSSCNSGGGKLCTAAGKCVCGESYALNPITGRCR